jgi:multicomponent Na+:H+ antiporter subunit B
MKSNPAGMSLIVKTVTRLTVGLILIYGIYIVLRGHISPGGGFAGGVIMALSLVHFMLAYGKDAVTKTIGRRRGISIASCGALLFLSLAFLTLKSSAPLRTGAPKHTLLSAGFTPFLDIFISVMVGAGLFTVVLALIILITEKEEQ